MSHFEWTRSGSVAHPRRHIRLLVYGVLAALLAMLALHARPASGAAATFSDVPLTHPYALAIADLAQRGAIGGYDDGTFKPEAKVLRQHFAKMIVGALAIPVSEADVCTFNDVPISGPGDLYPDNYIAAVFKAKITQGSSDPTKFKPLDNIRRTQLITMVVRAAERFSAGQLATPDAAYFSEGQLAAFTDPDHGDNVHIAEYVGLLYGIELEGWDLYDYATRGEVAQILLNMIRIFEVGAVYVAADGSGDYTTIHQAVAAAPSNSVIVVAPGTYVLPSTLVIDKSLHLYCDSRVDIARLQCSQTVLAVDTDGIFSAQGFFFEHNGSAGGDVAYVGCLVDFAYCAFVGADTDESLDIGGDGLWMRGNSAGFVRFCAFGANERSGIYASQNSQPTVEYCTSSTNAIGIAFDDTARGKVIETFCSSNSVGISVVGYAQVDVRKTLCELNKGSGIMYAENAGGVLEGNICTENGFNGIGVRNNSSPELKNNMCGENERAGIAFYDTSKGKAEGNTCQANKWNGIAVRDTAQPELKNNVCSQNEVDGITFYNSSKGKAEGNTCQANAFDGIAVRDTAQPEVNNNVCRQNQEGGITFYDNSGGSAKDNDCYGNGWGIMVGANTNPVLVDNDCYDNTYADLIDER